MKTGLIMEGGAMRGMFTAGVLDVLMENGIWLDGAVGVSAGAVFGCNYKSRQVGRTIRYNKMYSLDPRYCGLRSLLLTGNYYNTDFCYRRIPEELDPFDVATYQANPMPFYVVCTDMDSGEAILHRCDLGCGEDMDWYRASASMPLVSRPVKIDEKKYLDGGVAVSIPLKQFEEMGYARSVVILTQPRGFVKEKSGLLGLMKLALGRYPKLVHAQETRHERYNAETAYARRREAEGAAFILCPEEPLPIHRTERDPKLLQETYDLGRKVAEKRLGALKEFWGK